MRFRLVASDLDGTLLRTDETLAPRTKAVIHRALEHSVFVIATGRPPRWVHPVAELLDHRGVAVCSNGAVTFDLTNETVVDTRQISVAHARHAVSVIRALLPNVGFAVDRLHGFGHDPNYQSKFAMPAGVRVAPVDELLDEPCLKLLFRHPDMDTNLLAQIQRELGGEATLTYGATSANTGLGSEGFSDDAPLSLADTLIEVMAPGVSKASALARICDHHGVAHDDTVAFGDMPNDIEMLRWAGHGVAMANAHMSVKAVANEVTDSNDDDGVAVILERELGD